MKTSSFQALSMALGATFAVAALTAPGTSQAATFVAEWRSNAAGICQSALPAAAGAVLRARPLAVQNEGVISAFVTCSFPYTDSAGEQPSNDAGPALGAHLVNNSSVAVTINCTLVKGRASAFDIIYVVKSVSVPANGGKSLITFFASDLGAGYTRIADPNLSCSLPPGTGITNLWYVYNRQNGT